jgi:hypothetical protein
MRQESTRWTARPGPGRTMRAAVCLIPGAASVATGWPVNHRLLRAVRRIEQLCTLPLVFRGTPGPAEHRVADWRRKAPVNRYAVVRQSRSSTVDGADTIRLTAQVAVPPPSAPASLRRDNEGRTRPNTPRRLTFPRSQR